MCGQHPIRRLGPHPPGEGRYALSWSNNVNLFDKFKGWVTGKTYNSRQENLIYRGGLRRMLQTSNRARRKKNLEGASTKATTYNLVGTENIIPEGYSKVADKLATVVTAFPNCQIEINEKATNIYLQR